MTFGGTVMVVTAALVVAGGASCLSLLNNNVNSPDTMSGGQSVVYKTESASELRSNKWETGETAFAATDDSSVLTIDHAPRETDSFPMHRSGQRLAFVTEQDSALDQNRLENALHAQQIRPQSLPVKEPLTKLVEFDAAPFPYDGRRGSYHDRRVLLHIPKDFDARRHGDPLTAKTFANMPIIIVGYSGGFLPTAYCLSIGGLAKNRVRGVVLLDGVYGQLDKFATWIENNRSSFFISSYTHLTKRHNDELEHMLTEHDVAFSRELKPDLRSGLSSRLNATSCSVSMCSSSSLWRFVRCVYELMKKDDRLFSIHVANLSSWP